MPLILPSLPGSTPYLDRSGQTGFAFNPLDRLSQRRDDAAFIAILAARPDARTLVLAGDVPLLKQGPDGLDALFAHDELEALGDMRETAFLGLLPDTRAAQGGSHPLFARLLGATTPDAMEAGTSLCLTDLRSLAVGGLLAPAILGALGQAKSLMHWHRRHRFCGHCGAPTTTSSAGWRRECAACQTQHFPRTDPVVIMLAVDGERCLLGRQARFPPGMYSCLAGFLESGETIEDAVRREIHEEAGIYTGRVDYLASQPWPFPGSLMIGCIAQALTFDLTLDHEELEDARWFSRQEAKAILARTHEGGVTSPPPMAIATHLLAAWAAGDWAGK